MPDESAAPTPKLTPEEINRLWQHGLHEEKLFHDRLNYFSLLEMGLLTIYGVMYNKEPNVGFFLPLTVVALAFTLLWLVIQARHWQYWAHIVERQRRLIPEYRATVDEYTEVEWSRAFRVAKLLGVSIPAMFAVTWVAFFVWVIARPNNVNPQAEVVSIERGLIGVLILVVGWLAYRVARLEGKVKELRRGKGEPGM
jgi:hypothetical protein